MCYWDEWAFVSNAYMWHQAQISCASLWDHFRTNISRCCQAKLISKIMSNTISNNGHCNQIAGQFVVYNYEKPIRSRLWSGTKWMITTLRFNRFLVMGQRGACTIEIKGEWRHALCSGCCEHIVHWLKWNSLGCPGVRDYCLQMPLAETRQGIESATPHIDIQCRCLIKIYQCA